MWFAYNNMNCHNVKLSSRLYEIGSKKVKEIVSLYSKNKVMAKCLITSEIIKVDILEFKKNKNLVGINSGRFIGDNNVAKNKLVREKISNQLSGRIHCIDITNNKRLFLKETDFNDEVHHKIKPFSNNKGFTCVKTENGLMRLSVEEFKNSYLGTLGGDYFSLLNTPDDYIQALNKLDCDNGNVNTIACRSIYHKIRDKKFEDELLNAKELNDLKRKVIIKAKNSSSFDDRKQIAAIEALNNINRAQRRLNKEEEPGIWESIKNSYYGKNYEVN
jgi:stress-induced morphogen